MRNFSKPIEYISNKLTNKLLIALFVFAVAIFAWHITTAYAAGPDSLTQIGSAINFMDGNGFNILRADEINNINASQVTHWPYLYRILATPFLLISGKNVIFTYFALYMLSFSTLISSLAFFIKHYPISYKRLCIAGVFLFSAITFSPIKYMSDTDMMTLGITLFAISFLFRHFKNPDKHLYLLIFFLLTALLPQLRYAYVPLTLALIGFYFIVSYFKNTRFKPIHLSFVLLPVISLAHTLTNPFFTSKTAQYVETVQPAQMIGESWITWLKPFYAPFFNSFFPDYILVTFLQRFSVLYEKTILWVLALFSFVSLVIFIALLFYYLKKIKSFKNIFSKERLPETTLWVIILSKLAFYIFLYRNFSFSEERVFSGVFIYQYLAVVNRYFAPIHIGVFLLAIKYVIQYRSVFFKYLIILSLLFGTVHFLYLRTMVYHPYDRTKNMNIVSLPEGSYNDISIMGKIVKSEKKENETYFIDLVARTDENFRMGKPIMFAVANAAIILSPDAELSNAASIENISVLASTDKGQPVEIEGNWKIVYEGKVYDLYKLTE